MPYVTALRFLRCRFTPFRRTCTTEASTSRIRNVGIMAHIDAGKTTTTEMMLHVSGVISRTGDVDSGTTVTDYMEQERERGISITAAAVTFNWYDHRINLIDTPGHIDFTVEVERSLRVVDGAVVVLDGSAGVQAQTRQVWRQAQRFGIPTVVFVNKMDKQNANFDMCLQSIREHLHVEPLALQYPLLYDVNDKKVLMGHYDAVINSPVQEFDDRVLPYGGGIRDELLEQLAELDSSFADILLQTDDDSHISPDVLRAAVARVAKERKGVPVLCGSAIHEQGIIPLLDAITAYLPAPSPPISQSHSAALVFKLTHDVHKGALAFARIYAGALKPRLELRNITRGTTERLQRVFVPFADELAEAVDGVEHGNVVVLPGLTTTRTGDTLTDDPSLSPLEGIDTPEPTFFCCVEPPSVGKKNAFDAALAQLQREDPSMGVRFDAETQQTILEGMGELHIEVLKERLKREHGLDAFFGEVQVNYRETIGVEHAVEASKTIIEHGIGAVQLRMRVDPGHSKDVLQFHHTPNQPDLRDVLRPLQIEAIKSGVSLALQSGPLQGYPVTGLHVTLLSADAPPKTSVALTAACATECVHECIRNGEPQLLEPLARLFVDTPKQSISAVMADLAARQGSIEGLQTLHDESMERIQALVPLSEMSGFSHALRSHTHGLGAAHVETAGYRPQNAERRAKTV